MPTLTLVASAVPLIWLAWLVVTEWVPMFPLNDLRWSSSAERRSAAVINYPVAVLIFAGILINQTWSLIAALTLCVLVMVGHVASWWLPYFGISAEAQREAYQREYSRTLKILPTKGHDVVIDVQHMVVGVISAVMLTTTLLVTIG